MERRRPDDVMERNRIRRREIWQQRRLPYPQILDRYDPPPPTTRSGTNPRHTSAPHTSSDASPFVRMSPRNFQLHRHRLRRHREDDPPGSVQDTLDRLEVETSTLASAIEAPLPLLSPAQPYSPLRPEAADGHQPRHKRRKLEGGLLDYLNPVRYGYHGQVTPGRLRMQLVSCDGGYLSRDEDLLSQNHYPPDNVLRNDRSVYCSKRDKCNFVIRHFGETCFSMTKLVIKTPDAGFTAPVQEGLVFTAMGTQDLLSRTAHYQIREGPAACAGVESHLSYLLQPGSAPSRGARTGDGARPPSRRALPPGLQERIARLEPLLLEHERRSMERILHRTGAYPANDREQSTPEPYTEAQQPPESLPRNEPMPADDGGLMQPASGFSITVSCDSPSDDEEDPSSQDILLDRQRRRASLDTTTSGEEEEEEDDGGTPPPRRIRTGEEPRHIEWMERGDAPAAEPLEPLARFFISRKQHVVTLRFEPAVSARYVLLKLFSPEGRTNVDLQNVSVFGFAGPRWFPAVRLV